jgi:hypothetical protein
MATSLYKYLKQNGTTTYVFPSAAEDISAADQNDNFKLRFSKFVLLNIPRQNLTKVIMDPETSFVQSPASAPPATKTSYQGFGDVISESLRNYVANHDVTIKETRINQNDFFYDNTQLNTTVERIFWKWCRKLNFLDLEVATPNEEWFSNLPEFQTNGTGSNTDFFQEYLWRERLVTAYNILSVTDNGADATLIYTSSTNYKVGDQVKVSGTGQLVLDYDPLTDSPIHTVTAISSTTSINDTVTISTIGTSTTTFSTPPLPTSMLVYNRFVQYIGEVSAVNNVQLANRNVKEIWGFVSENAGQTPTVLFRTFSDPNYRPGLTYPILAAQKQPEIIGAESFASPIRSNPENYPGDHYGHFDAVDYTYKTSSGDSLRRSGDFYGIASGVNNVNPSLKFPDFDGVKLDGLILDFEIPHYAKMNIPGSEAENFDEFNALPLNGQPPKDFEFNAILWYYTVEDTTVTNGVVTHNLYGLEIMDNPENELVQYINLNYEPRVPVIKKLASSSYQDGLSYNFSLNVNYNIINENLQPVYDPTNINNIFSIDLFTNAMRMLAVTNDQFLQIINEFNNIKQEIFNLKGLLYSQTDIDSIKLRLTNAEDLLLMYSTLQIGTSDSIEPLVDTSTSPPLVKLNSVVPQYGSFFTENTSNLYNGTASTISPLIVSVPKGRSFGMLLLNDDQTTPSGNLPSNLKVLIQKDLAYRQSMDVFIKPNEATLNKKLDIYINRFDSSNNITAEELLIGNIQLPVDLYTGLTNNRSKEWIDFEPLSFIDLIGVISGSDYFLDLEFDNFIFLKAGDTIVLENFILDTYALPYPVPTINDIAPIDFSGQYVLDSVDYFNKKIRIEFTGNTTFQDIVDAEGSNTSIIDRMISNGKMSLNRGFKYTITRIDPTDTSTLADRYLIEKIKL